MKLALMGFILVTLYVSVITLSCADEQAQRQHWQNCGAVSHEECWDGQGVRTKHGMDCEYEYYKACINE
jgi:hypothetical protein